MPYQITITKLEENPNYKQQLEAWKENQRYRSNDMNCPEERFIVKKLDTMLTDEEFDAVRKACLGAI